MIKQVVKRKRHHWMGKRERLYTFLSPPVFYGYLVESLLRRRFQRVLLHFGVWLVPFTKNAGIISMIAGHLRQQRGGNGISTCRIVGEIWKKMPASPKN